MTDTLSSIVKPYTLHDLVAAAVLGSADLTPKILVLLQGREQNKPEVTPLHIQNPFEASLNVSKNVNAAQLDRFVALCQECSWQLEKSGKGSQTDTDAASLPWGLASLLLPSGVGGIKTRKKPRRELASKRIKSLLESLKMNSVAEKSWGFSGIPYELHFFFFLRLL